MENSTRGHNLAQIITRQRRVKTSEANVVNIMHLNSKMIISLSPCCPFLFNLVYFVGKYDFPLNTNALTTGLWTLNFNSHLRVLIL